MIERVRSAVTRLRGRLAEPWHRAFYRLMTGTMGAVVTVVGRYSVIGRENVPKDGPLIVVSNHLNNADPPLLGAAIGRRIRFMAKQELFQTKAGIFYRWFGAFPVRRFEADLAALRRAQTILREGGVLGMFPEGHRSHGNGMGPPHPGTALIALRTGAPILPVGITGTEVIRSPKVLVQHPPIRVVIGKPFRLPEAKRVSAAQVEAGTEEIMRRIAVLLPDRYRGLYADGGERNRQDAKERQESSRPARNLRCDTTSW
jgi:1-acyl-sn-glycerol-3-phosphate acyltransferase